MSKLMVRMNDAAARRNGPMLLLLRLRAFVSILHHRLLSKVIRITTKLVPSNNHAYCFPVSVKGVIFDQERKVVLLKNERNEWELPGGKLELGEIPEDCLEREIREELGLTVTTGPILDSWVYHIREGRDVLIVTYGCNPTLFFEVTHSPEHKAVGLFTLDEVSDLNMPLGYKRSITDWARGARRSGFSNQPSF